jgi:tol-pal system protein YbgF
MADLQARMADLKRQLHREKQRVEDLNNRVFLLQDQRARAARAKPRPALRPAARRVAPNRESAADIAQRKARRRLPVVKLRRCQRQVRRQSRRTRRLARRAKQHKRIVLRLTGTPGAPGRTGRTRMGPVPAVSHRLAVVPLPGGSAPPAAGSGALAEYRAARALFARKKYGEAARVFSRFTRSYPRHAYADNAQYWLAECFYRRGKVAKAAWVLRKLLKQYPSGNKASSALLKLGLCVRRLGRRAKARKILAQVVHLYPGTREAALAASYLRRRP